MNKLCYKIYHANLAFSAIPEESLPEVIDKCYFSLLDFVEKTKTKVGLEISGYSLEIIQKIRPKWIQKFKDLHKDGLVELVGSGYMQIIAPLVPYKINLQNQKIGLETYKTILGITPQIVFVNEQTFSTSLVDLYYEVGYKVLVMEWNNAYSFNNEIKKKDTYSPIIVKGIKKELPILWSDSILFQKFQRTVHKEREIEYYLSFLENYSKKHYAIPIYSSDLEIFNYRPGRFETEEKIIVNEWKRIETIVEKIKLIMNFELPSKVLEKYLNKDKKIFLTNSVYPIIVKKQDKYSLSRWAACGRGASYINTLCFRYFKKIKQSQNKSEWKTLLKYWGSDYRTHITVDKWNKAIEDLEKLTYFDNKETKIKPSEYLIEKDDMLIFNKENLKIYFNKRKGLTLDSLFLDNKKFPICTVHHGELDLIKNGADFFTGTTIIESIETKKIADLINVQNFNFYELSNDKFMIKSKIKMKNGFSEIKSWIIDTKEKTLEFNLKLTTPNFVKGSIRAGIITLDRYFSSKNGIVKVKNGGKYFETIFLKGNEINQHSSKSILQSSTSGIGFSNGNIKFQNDKCKFEIKVNRNISYPFIMLQNNKDKEGYLTRIYFSLQELDDTLKENNIREFNLDYKINLI